MEKSVNKHEPGFSPREIGSRVMKPIKKLFLGEVDYDHIFPKELAEQIEKGAPVPVLYSGPIYTQTPAKAKEMLREFDAMRDKDMEDFDPSLTGEEQLHRAIQKLEDDLPPSAFTAQRFSN